MEPKRILNKSGYDVTPDGKRFLLTVVASTSSSQVSLNLVVNWNLHSH